MGRVLSGFVYPGGIAGGGAGSLLNIQVFSVSDVYTPFVGTEKALVYVTGGGGAGGGADAGINKSAGGAGGAGGTIVALVNIDDTIPGAISIGDGGVGISGANGTNGSNTTFVYGVNTLTGGAGLGGVIGNNSANGEFILPADEGDGTAVGAGVITSYPQHGQLGSVAVYSGTTNTLASGTGGETYLGGAGKSRVSNGAAVATVGDDALINTGSAGGGAIQTNNNNVAGGNGGSGFVVVYEYAEATVGGPTDVFESYDSEFSVGNSTNYNQVVPQIDITNPVNLGFNLLTDFLASSESLSSNRHITFKDISDQVQLNWINELDNCLLFPSNLFTYGKTYTNYIIRVILNVDFAVNNNATTKVYLRLRRCDDDSIIVTTSFSQSDFPAQSNVQISSIIQTFVSGEGDAFVTGGTYVEIASDINSANTVTLTNANIRVFK